MSDEHLPKVTKALHRHASGYVEREGPGESMQKHQHADGTAHEDHAVAPNEYGLDENDWWGAESNTDRAGPV